MGNETDAPTNEESVGKENPPTGTSENENTGDVKMEVSSEVTSDAKENQEQTPNEDDDMEAPEEVDDEGADGSTTALIFTSDAVDEDTETKEIKIESGVTEDKDIKVKAENGVEGDEEDEEEAKDEDDAEMDEGKETELTDTLGKVAKEHPMKEYLDNYKVSEADLVKINKVKFRPMYRVQHFIVSTKAYLSELVEQLLLEKEIGVCIKYNSHSYFSRLCLLQISTRRFNYLVDTIKLQSSLHMLGDIFASPKVVKVMHGAVRVLKNLQIDHNLFFVNIFDTQLAMKRLQWKDISLRSYIEQKYNVKRLKEGEASRMVKWHVRPLPESYKIQAITEMHYLIPTYIYLKNQLIYKKLMTSFLLECNERCKIIFQPTTIIETTFPDVMYMSASQVHAINALEEWRHGVAKKKKKNVNFIVSRSNFKKLIMQMPTKKFEIIQVAESPSVTAHVDEVQKILINAKRVIGPVNSRFTGDVKLAGTKEGNKDSNVILKTKYVKINKPAVGTAKTTAMKAKNRVAGNVMKPNVYRGARVILTNKPGNIALMRKQMGGPQRTPWATGPPRAAIPPLMDPRDDPRYNYNPNSFRGAQVFDDDEMPLRSSGPRYRSEMMSDNVGRGYGRNIDEDFAPSFSRNMGNIMSSFGRDMEDDDMGPSMGRNMDGRMAMNVRRSMDDGIGMGMRRSMDDGIGMGMRRRMANDICPRSMQDSIGPNMGRNMGNTMGGSNLVRSMDDNVGVGRNMRSSVWEEPVRNTRDIWNTSSRQNIWDNADRIQNVNRNTMSSASFNERAGFNNDNDNFNRSSFGRNDNFARNDNFGRNDNFDPDDFPDSGRGGGYGNQFGSSDMEGTGMFRQSGGNFRNFEKPGRDFDVVSYPKYNPSRYNKQGYF